MAAPDVLILMGRDLSGAVPFCLEGLNAVRRTKGAGHLWGKKVMTQLGAISPDVMKLQI
jgi:hypothetical protein